MRINSKGFTLIELMVAIAVLGVLLRVAIPDVLSMTSNSRVREAAGSLQTLAMHARAEAIKRNSPVTLRKVGTRVTLEGPAADLIREEQLPDSSSANLVVAFDSLGRTLPFGTTAEIRFMPAGLNSCPTDMTCPAVRIDAGGSARICKDGSC